MILIRRFKSYPHKYVPFTELIVKNLRPLTIADLYPTPILAKIVSLVNAKIDRKVNFLCDIIKNPRMERGGAIILPVEGL